VNPLNELGFLAGLWSDGIIEEFWMGPKGGCMLGLNRTVAEGSQTQFEFLRIEERQGVITYWASPGGREPTAFVLSDVSLTHAVFENVEHDFPQLISYTLVDSKTLGVRVKGVLKGAPRQIDWSWTRVDLGR
jgi:hypothetical protein